MNKMIVRARGGEGEVSQCVLGGLLRQVSLGTIKRLGVDLMLVVKKVRVQVLTLFCIILKDDGACLCV